jgi:hypothetical protein
VEYSRVSVVAFVVVFDIVETTPVCKDDTKYAYLFIQVIVCLFSYSSLYGVATSSHRCGNIV